MVVRKERVTMIALISLFIPPLFLVVVREKVLKTQKRLFEKAIVYALSTLGLVWMMLLLLHYISDNTEGLFFKLNTYNDFACKYILLSMILAGSEPYVERFLRNDLKLHFSGWKDPANFKYWKTCAWIYAALLFFLNFIRIFDDNFWADEAATVSQMRGTFTSITAWAAGDVHPPLYYYMLKVVYMVFGEHGWAYHALSLIPLLTIIILSLTVFWREFGWGTSILLITFAGLSDNALCQNVEVRMYSWANLFVLFSFYGLWRIIEKQRKRDHMLFALFSLGAAYTHYFAMVSVAFFYLFLMILAFSRKKLHLQTVIATWIGTILGYMPWLFQFLKTVRRTADSYWVTWIPTVKQAISYLFSSSFSYSLVWAALLDGVVIFSLYETKILTVDMDRDKVFYLSISLDQVRSSDMAIWTAAGIFCIVGTIMFATIYSYLIRPVFTLRYIYAISVVAWIVLAVSISRLKFGKLWTVALWIYLLIVLVPRYQAVYMKDKEADEALQKTLEATAEIGKNDVILDNGRLMSLTGYYYPEAETKEIVLDRFPELDMDTDHYLFISGGPDMTATFNSLSDQGYDLIQILDDGYLGDRTIDVYRIEKRYFRE